jgi:arsenite methyltransferase
MAPIGRLKARLRLRTLAVLGPQLGYQHGPMGWVATTALNRIHHAVISTSVATLAPSPGETAADVGFGGGLGLGLLLDAVGPQGQVHGVEISDLPLQRARLRYRSAARTGRLHLHKAPVADLPLPDGSVDALMTVNTIHHFSDLGAAFRAVAAALTTSGRFVVAFPDPDRMRDLPVTATHRHRPRPLEEIRTELGAAGLRLVDGTTAYGGAYHVLLARPGP